MPYAIRPQCSIEGCEKFVHSRGWCSTHHNRWKHHGDPLMKVVRARAHCSVSDCDKSAWSQGLCSMHLSRLKRHGTTDDPNPTVEQRFWAKVDKTGIRPPTFRPDFAPCWMWTGAHNEEGHGLFFPERRAPIGAHRFSWELVNPPIAAGLHIDHLCRVPACVNPDHLEPVTPAENRRRGLLGVLKNQEI